MSAKKDLELLVHEISNVMILWDRLC